MLLEQEDDGVYSGPPQFDEDDTFHVLEHQLSDDIGTSLVLRHAFLMPRQSSSDVQRHALFQSTCTVNGKVCKFIVDSGSCENVITADAVQKLALSFEAHPKSYKLAWLQNGTSVTVSHRTLLTFPLAILIKIQCGAILSQWMLVTFY